MKVGDLVMIKTRNDLTGIIVPWSDRYSDLLHKEGWVQVYWFKYNWICDEHEEYLAVLNESR